MGKRFETCAAKMFPFLSNARVFHIVQLMWNANHQSHFDCVSHNLHENAAVILSVFSRGPVCTFTIAKSSVFYIFCILRDTWPSQLRVPLWILKVSQQVLAEKVSVSHIKLHAWQFPSPNNSDHPVISMFGNCALTK